MLSKNQVYSHIKANTDGFIFLRNSSEFKDDYFYTGDYSWEKLRRRFKFLEQHGFF